MEPKVTEELAEAEFDRFVEAMELDVDPKHLDDDDKKNLAAAKRTFVDAVMSGRLVVDDEGQPVYTTRNDVRITFYEPNGAALMAMDMKKRGHDIGKVIASMAAATRQDARTFADMPNRDLKVCQAIFNLFF